jgi:hypothetical protein
MRVFDCFTLDGPGAAPRYDWSDSQAGAGLTPRLFESGGSEAGVLPLDDEFDRTSPQAPVMARKDPVTGRPVGALIPATVPPNGSGRITRTMLAQWETDGSPRLAGGFGSLPVRGLVNINTAPLEVLKGLPHMSQMVYDDSGRVMGSNGIPLGAPVPGPSPVDTSRSDQGFDLSLAPDAGLSGNPTVMLAEAMEIYRNQLNPAKTVTGLTPTGETSWFWRQSRMDPLVPEAGRTAAVPTYQDRGSVIPLAYTPGIGAAAWQVPTQGSTVSSFAQLNGFDFTKLPTDFGMFVPGIAAGQPALPIRSGVSPSRGMRSQRGFESIGEVAGMGRIAAKAFFNTEFPDWQYDRGWSVKFAGLDPFRYSANVGGLGTDALAQGWFADFNPFYSGTAPALRTRLRDQEPLDARLSTDRQGVRRFDYRVGIRVPDAFTLEPDAIFGDSEEQNLLFKGISNLVSTRSDVFTVYLRVRTVRQDPLTGGWNGVDPESLVEDVRYVMGVDRSNVRRPSDQPRILYLERVED